MKIRTYGWIQNPSSFQSLKKVVQIFDTASQHYQNLKDNLINSIYNEVIRNNLKDKLINNENEFTYLELVGTSKNKQGKPPSSRKDAVADALIQISIEPQQIKSTGKTWTDNWTADGFLRWAVSFNFIKVDREKDTFSITEKGLAFSQANDEEQELDILRTALLAYPPATQILSLLEENGDYCTKYYLGSKLGFRGEKGFTSYNEDIMYDWLASSSAVEKKKIKSDIEGTSDKYARGICNWLKNVGFVQTKQVKRKFQNGQEESLQGYKITGRGIIALHSSMGHSSNQRIEKFIMWEFFATDGHNRDYIRSRRANIVKLLISTISFKNLVSEMRNNGFQDPEDIFLSDIDGLRLFGLRIELKNNKFRLLDKICDFSIPKLNLTEELRDKVIEEQKAIFLQKTKLPLSYIELLEIARDGKRSRDFELITMELFKNIYKINARILGGARKPDGVLYMPEFGVIVDTKAYADGYSKSIAQADEMIRYIEDNKRRDPSRNSTKWWEHFPTSIPANNFYFLWVSSVFVNKFHEQLSYTAQETQTVGAALSVEQLLLGADSVLKGNLTTEKFIDSFKNQEIVFAPSILHS